MQAKLKHIAMATALAAGTLAATQAAAAESFTGWGAGAGVSVASNSLEISGFSASNFASTTFDPTLMGAYGFALSNNWVANVGLTFNPLTTKYGTYTTSGGTSSTAEAKQHLSVSLAPGYRLGTNGLLYGKVALHTMDVRYTNNVGYDKTFSHTGTGFGVGYGWAISHSMELRAEYETIAFDKQNTGTTQTTNPKQDNFTVSLLYKF